MPTFGSKFGKVGEWWADRTRLEKILICVILVSILITVILSLRKHHEILPISQTCESPVCLKEAANIAESLNSTIDPCKDFFQFVYSNLLKNIEKDEELYLGKVKRVEILEMYKEDINEENHKMVNSAKRLFQSCMNVEQVEKDEVKTLKNVIKAIGGWPVLEGFNWSAASFDWLQGTYKLRELGYHFLIFLDLDVVYDPDNQTQLLYQMSSPDTHDYFYGMFDLDKVEIMADVAEIFGAPNKQQLVTELYEVQKFHLALQKIEHPSYLKKKHTKLSVEAYQEQVESFGWLTFINKIISPAPPISKSDFVLFAPAVNMSTWLDFISKTPKRTQANYMIWQLIERTIPYLHRDLRDAKPRLTKRQNREEFCLELVENTFLPNPITVMYNRKHLSQEKYEAAKELLLDIKSELIDHLQKAQWFQKNDGKQIIDKLQALNLVIGQFGDYLNDKILDDFSMDMVELQDDTFLSFCAQGTRNFQTNLYRRIPLFQLFYDKGYAIQPQYLEYNNSLYIPEPFFLTYQFDERQPHYLNYGATGAAGAYYFADIILSLLDSNAEYSVTKQNLWSRINCLKTEASKYVTKNSFNQWHLSADVIFIKRWISQQISYAAYENWQNKKGEELPLIATNYTPKQLFWLKMGITTPVTSGTYNYIKPKLFTSPKLFINPKLTADMFSLFKINKNFVDDFQCTEKPDINSLEKCQLF